jgi:hypothetical protein
LEEGAQALEAKKEELSKLKEQLENAENGAGENSEVTEIEA